MIVRVAIDLALDRLFTYEVPEALQKKLAVGQLLSVPFGHREARGFAMEVGKTEGVSTDGDVRCPRDGCGYALKPISAIVDEVPFFSPQLLELTRQIASYTASPRESVLTAALPAAVLKKNMRARELLYVEPIADASTEAMTGRTRTLYAEIVRLDGGWMTALCRELRTTPSTIRQLEKCGGVRIAVRAKRRDPLAGRRILPSKPLSLNAEQQAALDAIMTSAKTVLLHGVTGAGKTEVYLQAIAKELERGRGAIVMVPEIALTPQTVQRFAARFGERVAVLHSALSDGERYDEWHRIRSGAARVVVGPRSAVWAPVRDLGLIVVDEEHETSYKQDETPRYNARDVAVLRGVIEGAKVVLGSATPSLESWMNVIRGKYVKQEISCRAGAGRLPSVRLVDLNEGEKRGGERGGGAIFSRDLLEAIQVRLDRGEQTILFLNRRGYSRSLSCEACGDAVECPGCGIPYTYHRADDCLRCHVCGGWIHVPTACPTCGAKQFSYKGVGTERAEQALKKCFPRATVLRMDADSTSRKNSHDDILSVFRRGEADILIGTQMIAKGLDFPNVTLVGVLNADASLLIPDFRAAERTYQLLAQVAGRAGRAELPGEVLIQSRDVTSPVLKAVVRGAFGEFAASELAARREWNYPPYCHLALVNMSAKDLRLVGDWAVMYAKSLAAFARKTELTVSEPVPSALEKQDGWYRWQIVLRAPRAATIVQAWKWILSERPAPRSLRVAVDIDAFNVI